jgi:DNA-binding transcriptional regulator YiaG
MTKTAEKMLNHGTVKNCAFEWITVDQFRPDIGAPFEVILCDAVKQKICKETGEVLAIKIPNLRGLLKEVAVARSTHPRKFSAEEIKFVRKAVGLKALELSKLLGVGPEHLSRCENRERVLSVSAEKLFRMIVLKKRFNLSELEAWVNQYFSKEERDPGMDDRLREVMREYKQAITDVESALYNADLETVHDVEDTLAFSFRLVTPADHDRCVRQPCEDEKWKRLAA